MRMGARMVIAALIIISSITVGLNDKMFEGISAEFEDSVLALSPYVVVNQSGSGDFDNIQDGLDAVADNGTLFIRNGTYVGQFYVNRSMKIIGESKEGVTIYPPMINRTSVYVVRASDILFSNLTLKGYRGVTYTDRQSGINILNPIVKNVHVHNSKFSKLISMFTCYDNYEMIYVSNTCSDSSLSFRSGSGIVINNIIIEDSSFSSYKVDYGQYIQTSGFRFSCNYKFLNIYNNTFKDCNEVYIWAKENASIENNRFINVTRSGIIGLDSGVVANNTFENVTRAIRVGLYPYITSITNNTFRNVDGAIHVRYVIGSCNVEGNRFDNCSYGIQLIDYMKNMRIVNNQFKDAGVELFNRANDPMFDSLEFENNSVEGRPILLYHDVDDIDSFPEFGQLVLVNCNRYRLEGRTLSGGRNYPPVLLFRSDDGRISSNRLNGGDPTIWIVESEGTLITNNTLGDNGTLFLKECTGSRIYYNTFGGTNRSFFDDGSNYWTSSGDGNYWKGLNLTDSDGDGYAETVVNIPGGDNADSHPLVPGVDLGWEALSNEATTGETYHIRVTARSRNLGVLSNLSIEYGNDTSGYDLIYLSPFEHEQECEIPIPLNSIDDVLFRIHALDDLDGSWTIGPVSISVSDNDAPVIDVLNHNDELCRGDYINTSFTVSDNIEVTDVWYVVDDNDTASMPFHISGNLWILNLSTSEQFLGNHTLRIFCMDGFNNSASLLLNYIVLDGSPPAIVCDLSSPSAVTGGISYFIVVVSDDSGISSVSVNYHRERVSGDLELSSGNLSDILLYSWVPSDFSILPGDRIYTGQLLIPENDDSILFYTISVSDVHGNVNVSDERNMTVHDIIPPEVNGSVDRTVVGTGDLMKIDVSMSDNIRIRRSWVNFYIDGELYKNDTVFDGFLFDVPLDMIGELTFMVYVEDLSGNVGMWKSPSVLISDVILPSCTVVGDFDGYVGEQLRLDVNATDNVGVDRIHWSVCGIEGNGSEIEFRLYSSGEYRLSIEVFDTSGNVYYSNWTVSISERDVVVEDEEDGISPFFVVVAVFFAIALLVVAVIVLLVRRRGSSSYGEKNRVSSEE
ncbi:MAG TPA: hypothetical protein ENK47_04695 [Euryarchaeota archaeon]|nr:hypothetical protein [Euryarchaeota archaeon]